MDLTYPDETFKKDEVSENFLCLARKKAVNMNSFASSHRGSQSYNRKELNSIRNLNKLGKQKNKIKTTTTNPEL